MNLCLWDRQWKSMWLRIHRVFGILCFTQCSVSQIFVLLCPQIFRGIRFILVLDSTEYKTKPQTTVIYIRSFSHSLSLSFPLSLSSSLPLSRKIFRKAAAGWYSGAWYCWGWRLLLALPELWYGLVFHGPRLLLFHHILLRHQYRDWGRGEDNARFF